MNKDKDLIIVSLIVFTSFFVVLSVYIFYKTGAL
jgi:hypothetical protein